MGLFTVLLLLSALHAVFGCDCSRYSDHPQSKYCDSDTVIVFIGRVIRVRSKPQSRIRYTVRVRLVIKGSVDSKRIKLVSLRPPCDVALERGNTYLISAIIRKTKYLIGECQSLALEIPEKGKRQFIGQFDSKKPNSYPGRDEINCQLCEIKYCGLEDCVDEPPANTCTYFGDQGQIDCYKDLQCVPHPGKPGTCRWSSQKCG